MISLQIRSQEWLHSSATVPFAGVPVCFHISSFSYTKACLLNVLKNIHIASFILSVLFFLFTCHSYWWFSFYSNFNVFFMVNYENISIDTLWSIELIKLTEKVRAELSLKGEVLKMLKSMFKSHGRRVNSPGFMTWNAEIDF